MENENQFDHLLIRYLLNETNPEENINVSKWINADEKNRYYFEKLENAWHLLAVKKEIDAIDINNEWSSFLKVSDTNKVPVLIEDEDRPDESTVKIERSGGRTLLYKMLVSSAVAASVILIVVLAYLFNTRQVPERKVAVTEENKKIIEATVHLRHEVNTSGKVKQIVLQDGSAVLLYDNSELTLSEPFENNSRNVSLTGKAEFSVAKDQRKPFTVYSSAISTTALGTRFLVTSRKGDKNIIIRLYEGKVVVRSVENQKRKLAKDYFLVPGDELTYDQLKITASLKKFAEEKSRHENKIQADGFAGDNPSVPRSDHGSWYMFNNQTLSHVFDQLEDMFNIKIEYSKSDVRDKYFIGWFNKSDSLDKILSQITILNDLKVSKEKNKFIISK